MTILKRAYATGQRAALAKFAYGVDTTDDMITTLGAGAGGIGGIGAAGAAAGLGAGFTSPDDYGVGQAVRTGLGAVGGATLGEQGGAAAGKLLAQILRTNPELLREVGGTAGRVIGGGAGAHAGHTWANHSTAEDMRRERLMSGA